MPLLELVDLAAYLQRDIDTATGQRAIRVASGWLLAATRLEQWPDPVPDDLWAWATELAAIAYSNPEGLVSETIGAAVTGWSASRRAEILAAAQDWAGRRAGVGVPVSCFPPAVPLPDRPYDPAIAGKPSVPSVILWPLPPRIAS